jgi:hypothetical protein
MQSERQSARTQEAALFREGVESAIVRPAAARAKITELWNKTGGGTEFRNELEKTSWLLGRDERGNFAAIDSAGCVHGLAHRIAGATAANIHQRFADLDPKSVPSVADARKIQQGRQDQRTQAATVRAIARAKPEASHAPPSPEPRTRGRVGRSAGHVVTKVADSVFSALMGEKPKPKEKEPETAKQAKSAATPSQHRQELMRQLSREVSQEQERDAEIELDKGRERQRG